MCDFSSSISCMFPPRQGRVSLLAWLAAVPTQADQSTQYVSEWVAAGAGLSKNIVGIISFIMTVFLLFINRFCTLAYSRPHGCHDGLCSTVLSLPHSITNTKSHLILTVANIYNQMLRLRNASALVSEQWVSASQVQVSIFLPALCWWCSM